MILALIAAVAAATPLDTLVLTSEQRDALQFLYQYLPEADRADHDLDFYLRNVDASLRARRELPWGSIVPDREWRHFVLPVRVNNEDLDLSREVFYEELKPRVEGLSMRDAILEVNHWCHEKVTYKPSDGRTSSPLSSVSQAIGRCGEESTFAVAALRAVGIPARQVYTPRWAHTDDNHAWVEVWADGKWWFIGACEPEPVLNLAWFNAPASRGMLMTTNVFGEYDGPEEQLYANPLTTRINVTENYAPTHDVKVRVVDAQGNPAEGATVNFGIYNYAEYYPVASKSADAAGRASLTTGKGDIIVWASDGENFGITKANGDSNDEVTVTLDKSPEFQGVMTFDITPPHPANNTPAVTAEQRAENDRRFAQEDSIRNAYVATFATPESARAVARELAVDEEALVKILTESRGNHTKIVEYLRGIDADKRRKAIALLLNVSEKDRRDIPMAVVADHVDNTPANDGSLPEDIYNQYVLNPRVSTEGLTPYKAYLRRELLPLIPSSPHHLITSSLINLITSSPHHFITSSPHQNVTTPPTSPASVWRERTTDPKSRNIFFVAAARSLGIPARIDPVTGKTQYLADGDWVDVSFETINGPVKKRRVAPGELQLTFTPEKFVIDPKYYSSFSISKIDGGLARQLEYDENATYTSTFAEPVSLDAGQYVLTTGQRLANGGVLARSEFFTIQSGETTTLPLEIRQTDNELSVIGSLNAEDIYHNIDSDTDVSLLATAGRGYYVVGLILPNHEPSAHTLNDISAVADALEATGRKIILLFPDADAASRFRRDMFPALPANVTFGIDTDGRILSELTESLHLPTTDLPLFVVADSFNRIVQLSQGYTIGLGEALARTLLSLE